MDLLNTLNDKQQEAVIHNTGPLLILAGAGSGKTRVLTHRIAYLINEYDVNPYRILAITFTNKAAKEMRERVDRIVGYGSENIFVSTFHSTCVRILRRFIEQLGYDRNFTIYDAEDQKSLMREVLKALQIDPKQLKERACMSVISSAKDELISPEAYEATAFTPIAKRFAAVYREYQRRLKLNNALDFDDLIYKTVELFRTCPDTLSYYQRRFHYILVDEYQDTNSAQFQLIKLLASCENENGDIEHNLCVVGDDDQSIYKFRGANIYNILNFEKEYPDTKVIKLEQNYRSTQSILEVANEVIRHNVGRKDKVLWTGNDKGAPVHFCNYENDADEASGVADIILSYMEQKGAQFRDFAVLYRTNAQSLMFEKILRLKNIKAKTVGSLSFFQRKEVKDIIAYLKTVDNAKDNIAVKRIINVPKRGIGTTSVDKVQTYAVSSDITFYEALEHASVIPGLGKTAEKISSFTSFIDGMRMRIEAETISIKELIDEILTATDYLEELRDDDPESAQERTDNIDALISYAERYVTSEPDATLTGFLEYCGLNSEEAADESEDNADDPGNYVSLMTLHNAKGLEFPYVFLTGLEEGLFPGYMSISAENPEPEIEEERRLCYVGITRAMRELFLSAAKQRLARGEVQFNATSRFLNDIPRHLLEITMPAGKKVSFRNSSAFSESPIRKAAPVSAKSVPYTMPAKNIGGAHLTALSYVVGDSVSHIKFGIGTVTSIVQGGRDYEVTVEFKYFGVKKLLASFANLKKVT